MADDSKTRPGRSTFEKLDRVIHEKARLEIMTSLVGSPEGLSFNDLRQICGLTDGNLNRHLKVLVDAGMVHVEKSGRGRSTRTQYSLSDRGKQIFEEYVSALESIVQHAQSREPNTKPLSNARRKRSDGDGSLSVSPG